MEVGAVMGDGQQVSKGEPKGGPKGQPWWKGGKDPKGAKKGQEGKDVAQQQLHKGHQKGGKHQKGGHTKGNRSFGGYCGGCGRYGYRRRDCRAGKTPSSAA
eukprot:gnl/TRDRNA2_/TRDRNA2_210591_c0_seq1.p1 gnl/TRDRNA2_/TRDRNA2_210591_c0~~gnl/TRDRNA2_/TRDRNA2_210591_c0_seq1.p1  ORF type:complete len:101 (+),score=22.56 gnl/TRDRNA2_/TRDRNA2_210591_c0_seq1:319-621(+)